MSSHSANVLSPTHPGGEKRRVGRTVPGLQPVLPDGFSRKNPRKSPVLPEKSSWLSKREEKAWADGWRGHPGFLKTLMAPWGPQPLHLSS